MILFIDLSHLNVVIINILYCHLQSSEKRNSASSEADQTDNKDNEVKSSEITI